MTLEQFLGNRYRLIARLPALGATHQRYAVQASNGTPDYLVLSYCDYAKPLSMDSLAQQRRAVEVMMRPPVGLLCRVIDFQLKPDHQWTVSEYPGDYSLRELLQQRQSLTMEEVEAFLRLLTEACEAATALGWPRLNLEASHLYLDARLGLPRIPAPDVPAFENAGSDADMDPMATMQFSAAALRAALVDPMPKDTHEYVLPLAALACDLLGQPQHMRGGNARYQPVPQLTSQQNVLLRRALTSEGRAGFSSAKGFMDEFFGVSMQPSMAAHTERLRTLTVASHRSATGPVPAAPSPPAGAPSAFTTGSHAPGSFLTALISTSSSPASSVPPLPGSQGAATKAEQPVNFDAVTVKMSAPPPLPPAKPAGPTVAALSVTAADREKAQSLSPTIRIRLVPDSEEAPIFALVGEETLVLGRSAGDADFIAQFRPRSNMNDARSRRVSRAQARAQLQEGKLVIEESEAVNPSVLQDAPIPGFAEVELPVNFLLAGEFPIEARAIPTDFVVGREVKDWPLPEGEGEKLHGAVILRPGGSGVLLCEAAMILSDVGIHFSKSGRPWLRADSAAHPVARIQRFAGQFWFEPVEASVVAVATGTDLRSKTNELILLTDGAKVRLGPYGYTVQTYNLPTANASDASQAA
jgi:hypothetical protein